MITFRPHFYITVKLKVKHLIVLRNKIIFPFSTSGVINLRTLFTVYVWVLGRQTTLNDINLGRVMHLLNENFGINYSELTNIDHNDSACYALPIIEPGNPIILPGQCDESLQVLPNFNATAVSIDLFIRKLYNSRSRK